MTQNEAIKQLQELIPIYHANKLELDSYKKLTDKDNKKIKELMLGNDINEVIAGDVKATLSISCKYDFIEDKLLDTLKQLGITDVIETKEIVNMDALESAIYNGRLSAAVLDTCREKKETVTLRVK